MDWRLQTSTWLIGLTANRNSRVVRLAVALVVFILLCAGSLMVALTGGTPNTNAHFMYVPVFLAATVFGIAGGLVVGLIAGLMLGPLLGGPLDTFESVMTSWGTRTLWFMVIGSVAGLVTGTMTSLARERHRQALTDPASGLPNQAALMEDLTSRLTTTPADTLFALVLLRATDLNEIVEVVGVEHSDRVVLDISDHLMQTCPEVQGRYRVGISVLALTIEADSDVSMKRAVEAIHDAASAPFNVDSVPIRIEPALGIGRIDNDESLAAKELLRRARVALGNAVSLERKLVSYEPEFDTVTRKTLELVAHAEQALHAGEFELFYQPKIRLSDRQPVGVEALARWRRPGEGIIAPGSFMPKLERTSLIDAFSRFVIQSAATYAHSGLLVPVSINLAPRNLTDESLVEVLITSLREAKVSPELFEVEITESGLMREPEATIQLIHRLRDHGVGVSIDDFGTGYSSFSYLRTLPVSGLKIDQAFVRPLDGDARAQRLVRAMIETGHALDLQVTAEGIETEEQADILTELGCDLGQGFLWSPALEQTALADWVTQQKRH